MADELNRTVLTRAVKTSDIEVHVSLLLTPQGQFVEIREYIKSLDQYGRGITFPNTEALVDPVYDGIRTLALDNPVTLS